MQSHTSGPTHFPPFRQAGLQIAVRIQNYVFQQLRYFKNESLCMGLYLWPYLKHYKHWCVFICDLFHNWDHWIPSCSDMCWGPRTSCFYRRHVCTRLKAQWHANTNNTWSDSLRQKANTYLPPSVALKHRKRKRIQILYTIPILNVYLSLLIKASCCKSAGDGSVIFLEHYHACCLRFTLSSSFKRSEKYRADLNSWVTFAT